MQRLALRSLVLFALVLFGCDERRAPTLAPLDRGAAPDPARDPLGARLHAAVVARSGRMEEVGAITRGAMAIGGSAEQGMMLYGAHCYVVFVEAAPSAGDVRLRLVDSNGDPVQIDRDRGASATLGLAEPLCPERPSEFRLELSSPGGGDYAMRVFRAQAL